VTVGTCHWRRGTWEATDRPARGHTSLSGQHHRQLSAVNSNNTTTFSFCCLGLLFNWCSFLCDGLAK